MTVHIISNAGFHTVSTLSFIISTISPYHVHNHHQNSTHLFALLPIIPELIIFHNVSNEVLCVRFALSTNQSIDSLFLILVSNFLSCEEYSSIVLYFSSVSVFSTSFTGLLTSTDAILSFVIEEPPLL